MRKPVPASQNQGCTQARPIQGAAAIALSRLPIAAFALLAGFVQTPAARAADSASSAPPVPAATLPHSDLAYSDLAYSDLVDLAEAAPVVVRAQVRQVTALDAAHASPLRGRARVYVEARTEALLAGRGAVGETLRYLADVPADTRGRPLSLKKRSVLLFARIVPDRVGELQLVAPDGQVLWDPALETRVRGVLAELLAAGAPPKILRVREALYVPGNLTGEGETQMSLTTQSGTPVSLTVVHRPGAVPRWGLSLGEIVDEAAVPPQPGTLTWYRLACTLAPQLPVAANVSASASDRALAEADYGFVRTALGPCGRTR